MTILLKLSSSFQILCRLYCLYLSSYKRFIIFFVTHVPANALVGEIKFIYSFIQHYNTLKLNNVDHIDFVTVTYVGMLDDQSCMDINCM